MRMFKIILGYLFGPMNLICLRVVLRFGKYGIFTTGTTTFLGPREFLEVCSVSLRGLASTDAEVHAALTRTDRYTFWYDERNSVYEDIFTGVYNVPNAFFTWGSDGVTARMIEAYYTTKVTSRRLRGSFLKSEAQRNARETRRCIRDWLSSRKFPEELIECYK